MNHLRFAVAALAAASLAAAPVLAADNMTVKDSTGATITMRSKDVGSGLQATVHVPFDSAGGDMTDTALHALRVEGVVGGVALPISGSVSVTGTLPAFAATPTFNIGAAIPTGTNIIGAVGNTQGSTTAGQSGPLVQGAVTSGAPTYTTAQTSPLSLDTAGNLRVNLVTGALPTGAATAANQSTEITNQTSANTKLDTLHTDNTSLLAAVNGAIPAGTAIIGKVGIDQTTDGTTNAVHLVAGTAIAGKVGIDQTTPGTTNAVQLITGTSGGTTAYGLQTAATTNSTSVKASAGVLYGMNLINTTTTIYYLRMYDAAAAPTCSSATGFVRTWPVPPAAAAGGGGGIAVSLPSTGTQFSTGIGFCVTGGPTSTDNTSAATGVFINLDYK